MNKPELVSLDIKSLEAKCNLCQTIETLAVRPEDFEAWMNGRYAQDAFPYLTADQRELLVSGTCGPCFDRIFPEDDE